MKYLLQISIIGSVSFAGELLNTLIPLPVPGSIYGLVLMLFLLMTGIVKLEQVKTVGDWLISFMPIMFVGPAVGLMSSYDSYKTMILPLFLISVITTIITMAATGSSAQFLMRLQHKEQEEDTDHAE